MLRKHNNNNNNFSINFESNLSKKEDLIILENFEIAGVATFSSSTIKEQKRNPFQDFNSPRFSSTKEGEGACIQNVPRATWIILWDVFKRNESGQRESFAQTKILASTDFNFRTEWFHSKVNEQRVYIYKFPKYFPPNESLSSSRYVQGVSQKIFVNSNNPLRVTAFLLTRYY